ncbi:MAG: hypothetical protein ABIV63_06795, partial [Caldimonas sp.]
RNDTLVGSIWPFGIKQVAVRRWAQTAGPATAQVAAALSAVCLATFCIGSTATGPAPPEMPQEPKDVARHLS